MVSRPALTKKVARQFRDVSAAAVQVPAQRRGAAASMGTATAAWPPVPTGAQQAAAAKPVQREQVQQVSEPMKWRARLVPSVWRLAVVGRPE
jgi:hypothetical protein